MSGSDKSLTISDIAKELGVSKTTVSRAISGKGRISEATRKRIRDYIEIHNYRPNVIAKSLAESKTFNIGVVLPADTKQTEIPFFQSCLMGICDTAAGFEYDVVVLTSTENDISLIERLIRNHKVDGIVLTRPTVNDLAISYLKKVKIPFVVIGSVEDEEVVQIDNHHISGCAELTSVLLKIGYEKIALLAGSRHHIITNNRYKGFIQAFENHGKSVNEKLVFLDLNSHVQIDRAVDLAMNQEVDCIICSDDVICSRALIRLGELGVRIPQDIKIASFYDSIHLANYNPPITSLKIDIKALGIEAGKVLISLINGEEVPHQTLLDYEIVLKKSTM